MARRFVRRAEERVRLRQTADFRSTFQRTAPTHPCIRASWFETRYRAIHQERRLEGWTTTRQQAHVRMLAAAFARALHLNDPRKCRGRREGRVLAAPVDPRAKRLRESAKTTGTGGITRLACAVVYGLLRALPGEPAFATVIFAMPLELCDNLAPAWARQDHTASPSAHAPHVHRPIRVPPHVS